MIQATRRNRAPLFRKRPALLGCLLASVFLGSLPAQAAWEGRYRQDVHIEGRGGETLDLEPHTMTILFSTRGYRIEDAATRRIEVLDRQEQVLRLLDPVAGVYTDYTFEELDRRREALRSELEHALERTRELPEMGARLRSLCALLAPRQNEQDVQVEVLDRGEEEVGGAPTRQVWLYWEGDEFGVLARAWFREELTGGPEYIELLAEERTLFPCLIEPLLSQDGFPVKLFLRKQYPDREEQVIIEFEELNERAPLPEATFELPQGMRRVSEEEFETHRYVKPASEGD